MATELQQHGEGIGRDSIHTAGSGLVKKELGFNVAPQELEAVYRSLSGTAESLEQVNNSIGFKHLHFPSLERLQQVGDPAVDKVSGTSPGAALIGVNGNNLPTIGSGHANLQSVLEQIDNFLTDSTLDFQFNDNGIQPSEIVREQRQFFSQFTRGTDQANHEVVGYLKGTGESDPDLFGSNINFQANWTNGTGWTITAGTSATFLAPETPGETDVLTYQTDILKPNRWYKFTYVVGQSENAEARLTTAISAVQDMVLNLNVDGHTVYFKTANFTDAPLKKFFIRGVAGTFTLTSVSLKEVQGGDVHVHGKITGGGDRGIKIFSSGQISVDGLMSSQAGSSGSMVKSIGVYGVNTSAPGPITTTNGEEPLYSRLIDAGTLVNRGDSLRISAVFLMDRNISTTNFIFKIKEDAFGDLIEFPAIPDGVVGNFTAIIAVHIIKITSNPGFPFLWVFASMISDAPGFQSVAKSRSPSMPMNINRTFTFTGRTTRAADTIQQPFMLVEYLPANAAFPNLI